MSDEFYGVDAPPVIAGMLCAGAAPTLSICNCEFCDLEVSWLWSTTV